MVSGGRDVFSGTVCGMKMWAVGEADTHGGTKVNGFLFFRKEI